MIIILKSSFWNLFGTLIVVLSGAVLTLLAPKILSVEDFGLWRTFMLYSTYAGILHLGIADGYLLNNVSLSQSQALKNLRNSLPFLVLQQIVISLLIFLVLLFTFEKSSSIFIAAGVLLFSIVLNIRTLIDNYLIIIKDFKTSNIVKILDKVIYLILIVIMIVFLKASYEQIMVYSIIASLLALLILFWKVRARPEIPKQFIQKNVSNIKIGSQLFYSNILIIVLFNIDSIVVSLFLGNMIFAVFSFAITIVMLINQFAESISQVFFPYLATDLKENMFKVNKVIVFAIFGIWLLIMQFTYLLVPVIEWVYPKYAGSIPVLLVYLLMSLFTLIIRVSQNNLYKVQLMQVRFIKIELVVFLFTIVSLALLYKHLSILAIAFVILAARAIWYLLNEFGIGNKDRSILYLLGGFVIYSLLFYLIYTRVDMLIVQMLAFFIISLPVYIGLIKKIKGSRQASVPSGSQ
nr:oligosaccharide flippase family protein [uncultured Bacillus sp.]